MLKTIIVGLGNPVISDECVGIIVARALKPYLIESGIDVKEAHVGGLCLLDILEDYERAVIIDAASNMSATVGDVQTLTLKHKMPTRHTGTTHDMDLLSALNFGREIGMVLPQTISIWGIEVNEVLLISEKLTMEVQASIPRVVQAVINELGIEKLEYAHEQEGCSI